jgi:hypothetical protein
MDRYVLGLVALLVSPTTVSQPSGRFTLIAKAADPNAGAVGSSTCTERIAQVNLEVVKTPIHQVTHEITVKAINFGGQVTEITNIKLVAQ